MSVSPAQLLRDARQAADLSQSELATRLGTTQSAIARLERPDSNPRLVTLERAISACRQRLVLAVQPSNSSIDDTQVGERLRLTPGERIKLFERSYANVRELALAAAGSRGELA